MNPVPSQNFPILLTKDATWIEQIQFLNNLGYPVNLTGFSAKMKFRPTVGSTGTPIIDLSTSDSSIVINPVVGTITTTISASVTSTLSDGQQMVYNLFIYSPTGVVTALLAGPAYVNGSTI